MSLRPPRPTIVALLALVVAAASACGPSTDDHDAAADYVIAPRAPLPQVPHQDNGPVLAHPEVVTITFADDPDRAAHEAYDAWVVTSHWLTTVGADYGVGAGTSLPPVELATNAPDAVIATDVDRIISNALADGTIPTPPGDNTLYVVYFPQHTTYRSDLGQSCVDLGGYHAEGMGSGYRYAAVFSCPPTFFSQPTSIQVQITASHELIEAATDPYPDTMPGFQFDPMTVEPWSTPGGEVADMCEFGSNWAQEDGHYVARVWSNSAAAGGTDPCLPTVGPWFGVTGTPDGVRTASAGEVLEFTLTGYSSAPMDDWELVATSILGSVHPRLSLDATHVNNGGTVHLRATVPTTAMSGDFAVVHVASLHGVATDDGRDWPVVIEVP